MSQAVQTALEKLPELHQKILAALKRGLPTPEEGGPATAEEIAEAIGAPVAKIEVACSELREQSYITAFATSSTRGGGQLEYGISPNSPIHGTQVPEPQTGFEISSEVARKLERMHLVNVTLKAAYNETLNAEYCEMQTEMVEVFLPVVAKLMQAGLLTIHINLEGVDDLANFRTLFGEPLRVFRNGNIWIEADEHSGGVLRQEPTALKSIIQ